MSNEAARESSAEDVARLRGCLNDLVRMMTALPEVSMGEPSPILSTLLDATRIAATLDQRVAQRTSELLAANQRLTEEISQSRSIIDSIPAGIALMTPQGDIEFINRQLLQYLGRTFEALKNWVAGETVHPDDRPRVLERFEHSVATGDRYDNEERHLRFDGIFRWFRVLGVPLRDATGTITRWCVLHIDIDERKRAEAARRDSERESRLIVDTIPGLVATLTPAGEVEVVNPQLVEYAASRSRR